MRGHPARLRGTVISWKNIKQYGFVEDDRQYTYFIHRTYLIPPLCNAVMEVGMRIEFEPAEGEKGDIALNCTLIDADTLPPPRRRSRSRSPSPRKRQRSFSPEYVPYHNDSRRSDSAPRNAPLVSSPTTSSYSVKRAPPSDANVSLYRSILDNVTGITKELYSSVLKTFVDQQRALAARDVQSERKMGPDTLPKASSNFVNALSFLFSTLPSELSITYVCGLHCIIASGMPYAGVLRQAARPGSHALLASQPPQSASATDVTSAMMQEANALLKDESVNAYELAAWLAYTTVHV